MSAVAESGSHSINGETLQALVAWLKTNGSVRHRQEDARMAMVQRYPAGLLSDDELEALTGFFVR
ncbi:hypothetical protein SFA35_24475 [Pseudomonas sp. HR96]|uniref:hypothetical protein n=1 Tax=Pseudomonas sp. HR96 TaxID=1027966 RepID=UPI002A7577A7|nr:hypothetical protein [Pseudomonas sp. HR96]WPO99714.1 hypothetical protein SFA35_24475 [Pseudomonas sp. HR96]